MNKIYRLLWSQVKNAWIVAAEKVKGHGGPAPVTVAAALIVASLSVGSGVATALPTGAQIVSGTAGITTTGTIMTVTNSANAIINWQGFNIGSNETTRFIQPSALSAVLNRVTGGNPSQILGALQSNGKVLLINPSGIIFGPGARVDVNGLIASSLDITNQNFLAGRMKFTAGPLAGKVENQGTITTPSGGSVYLIAPDVQNSGVITAPNGDVLLAAGKEVLLVDSTNPEIAMVVTAPEGQSINLGTIVADAGRVGMYGSVVRQKGRISANSAVQDVSGRIYLKATKEVTLEKDSVTTATGTKGGSVQILGQHAGLLDNAVVDVSGTTGGGTVLVGGDYQGKNPLVQNAEATYMGKDAVIKADATDNGNGGKVILWADNATRAYGSIYAKGGVNGGDGGFVETSGHYLSVEGIKVSTSAKYGKSGTWLLDPTNIYIAVDQITATGAGMSGVDTSINTSTPFNFVASGAVQDSLMTTGTLQSNLISNNVSISTANAPGTGVGDIKVVSPVNWDGFTYSLTLTAANNIVVNASLQTAAMGGGDITLAAGNQITLNAPLISTSNSTPYGTVTLTAGSGGIASGGSGTVTAQNLGISSSGNVSLPNGNIFSTVAATITGNLNLNNTLSYSVGSVGGTDGITASGNVTLHAVDAVTQSKPISANGLELTATGAGTYNLNSSNSISTLAANVPAGFSFTNGSNLVIGAVNTTGITSADEESAISITSGGTLVINQNVTHSAALNSINLSSVGAMSGGGTIEGANINFQTGGQTGAIGVSGTPLLTSGTSNINFGMSSTGPSAVYMSHTGVATLGNSSLFLGANAPFSFLSSGNLSVPAINTGTSALTLKSTAGTLTTTGALAGNVINLTAAGNYTPGGDIIADSNLMVDLTGAGSKFSLPAAMNVKGLTSTTIKADKIDLTAATVNLGTSLSIVTLVPKTAGQNIILGSDTSDTELNLTTNELNKITATTLRIGDNTSGPVSIGAAIAPTSITNLVLGSGSTVGQVAAGTITVTNLGVKSLGTADLSTAPNVVSGSIAAGLGDGSNLNSSFEFKNSGTLNVGTVDSIPGIAMQISGVYDSASQNGVISLYSTGGSITQSAGSLLSGKAVQATAGYGTVNLTLLNPTGVVAGSSSTTGIAQFSYTTAAAAGINVNSVDGAVGITNTSASANLVSLKGPSVSQASGALITANYLEATATTGSVTLANSNAIATAVAGSAGGNFSFKNASAFAIGTAGVTNGITAAGGSNYISLTAGGAVTQSKPLAAGGLQLLGTGSYTLTDGTNNVSILAANTTGGVSVTSTPSSGSFTVGTVNGTPGVNSGGAVTLAAAKPISIITPITGGGGVSISDTDTISGNITVNSGVTITSTSGNIVVTTLVGTAPITTSGNYTASAGSIAVSSQGGLLTLGGGTYAAGSSTTLTGSSGVAVNSPVNVSSGSVTLTATTGNIGLGASLSSNPGSVTLSASMGSINDASSGSASYLVKAPSLSATAYNGIGSATYPLKTVVSSLSATTSMGDIAITNNSGYPGALTITGLTGSPAGKIIFDNYGTLTTTGAITAGSDITIQTHSPLTIGSGGVQSTSNGNIILSAGNSGTPGAGDTLTLNGAVTTGSGSITLKAGDSIVENIVPTTSGTITRQPNLNPLPLPTLADCIANPSLTGCTSVLPSLATCTTAPTTPGCSVVLPTIATCTSAPTTPGCSAVLPTIAVCTSAPTTPGCSVVLPTIATCTSAPTTPGCSVVLPSLAACTATPTLPGCSAVLPTIATCTANPTVPGCSVVLPSVTACIATPTLPGCSVVLPTMATCTSAPTTPGCSVVLPTIATCTSAPTTPGCSVVLPSLAACTVTPTLPGCSAVLPTIATCTANPTVPGCSVVLPSVTACIATPTLPGCSVVLPTIATCTSAPATPGCSVVLPNLAACTATPTLPGCSVVLPSLATCTVTPTLPGCSVVLPTIAACTSAPATPGCSVVLPSLAACTASPALPGCSVVLPTIASCTANPTAQGCTAVLPTLATCISNPAAPGCTAVLPSMASCTAAPTTPGCSAVLPSIATCTSNPTAPGCTVVLPTLATCTTARTTPGCSVVLPSMDSCIAAPTTPGCIAVLPTLADCAAIPSAPGCWFVVPAVKDKVLTPSTNQVVNSLEQLPTTPVAPAGLQLIAQVPPPQGSSGDGGSGEGGNNSDGKDKDKDKNQNGQGQPDGGGTKNEPPKKKYCN